MSSDVCCFEKNSPFSTFILKRKFTLVSLFWNIIRHEQPILSAVELQQDEEMKSSIAVWTTKLFITITFDLQTRNIQADCMCK